MFQEPFEAILDLQTKVNLPLPLVILFNVVWTSIWFFTLYVIARYVFFEEMWHGKRAKFYYVFTLIISCAVGTIFGSFTFELFKNTFRIDFGVAASVFFVFVASFIGRKKFKWITILQIIPWYALTEGFIIPLTEIPTNFINADALTIFFYQAIAYGVILLAYLAFIIFGRKFRAKAQEDAESRKLANWERIMLYVTGIVLLVFLALLTSSDDEAILTSTNQKYVDFYIICFAVATFMLDLITVVTVMVSNKQSFYHKKVLDMQFNIISMMAEIVENRDENTGGHIQRTAKYVDIIANELRNEGLFKKTLTRRYIRDMKVAAPLHDIGKIHVSDLILNKPGKLDDKEFEIMKTHAEEGRILLTHARDYLGKFSYLDVAVDMAGSHHEWWDGKGYPNHLKGEEIPLCARIMAVADVFDALTSARCYRDAMSIEQAYRIIMKESGTHFDATVVEAFFNASEEVEEALNEFNKEQTPVETQTES